MWVLGKCWTKLLGSSFLELNFHFISLSVATNARNGTSNAERDGKTKSSRPRWKNVMPLLYSGTSLVYNYNVVKYTNCWICAMCKGCRRAFALSFWPSFCSFPGLQISFDSLQKLQSYMTLDCVAALAFWIDFWLRRSLGRLRNLKSSLYSLYCFFYGGTREDVLWKV